MAISGTYGWEGAPGAAFTRSELRLDVDGPFPQFVASGTEQRGLATRIHWIVAPLIAETTGLAWQGSVAFLDPRTTSLFPFDSVRIEAIATGLRLTLTGGVQTLTRDYALTSTSFRRIEFEYDAVDGVVPVLEIGTHAHPDRPISLVSETLSIDEVYRRAGFDVSRSSGSGAVPISLAGANERWSNSEMHDAMQIRWASFASQPRWALWTLFAALHEDGPNLGGIMFDSIGQNQRQGTALFLKSFIANAPAGDTAPDEWVKRMKFWTAVHEMGHAFNLLHAWEKDLGNQWVPQQASFDLLSFMNYPYLFRTGMQRNANTIAFFQRFEFRFSNAELLFMRHAPERFVEMGGANWADDHAFEQAQVSPDPPLALVLRVNRETPTFEFLEPVVVEVKLTNRSVAPCLVPSDVLRSMDRMTVIVRREGQSSRLFRAFSHECRSSDPIVLPPNQSIYESLFLAVGVDGWLIAEPGRYQVQVCLHLPGEDVVSAPLALKVSHPDSRDEERLALDYFTEDVGRVLGFDGSNALKAANTALDEVIVRVPKHPAAIHAKVARNVHRLKPQKVLDYDMGGPKLVKAPLDERAAEELEKTLREPDAPKTLGHIDYGFYAQKESDAVQSYGKDATAAGRSFREALSKRGVPDTVLATLALPGKPERL